MTAQDHSEAKKHVRADGSFRGTPCLRSRPAPGAAIAHSHFAGAFRFGHWAFTATVPVVVCNGGEGRAEIAAQDRRARLADALFRGGDSQPGPASDAPAGLPRAAY
jgi:hypothetical protein